MANTIEYKKMFSKAPGRTGWQAVLGEVVIATGFCDEDKFPGEAIAGAISAQERPYEAIRKTFLPLGDDAN